MMNLGHAVYVLCDPETMEVRYVGYSKNVEARYGRHLSDTSRTHRGRWIRKLLQNGQAPRLKVLCVTENIEEGMKVEVAMIAAYRGRGARLTNATSGGEGFANPSAECRAKLSAALKGRTLSESHRANLRAARKSQAPGAGRRAGASTGWTPERRARMSMLAKERAPFSAEHRARLSAALKGRTRKFSEERNAKISATLKGRRKGPMSEEAKAKISASCKAFWAKKTERKEAPPVKNKKGMS